MSPGRASLKVCAAATLSPNSPTWAEPLEGVGEVGGRRKARRRGEEEGKAGAGLKGERQGGGALSD